MKGWKRKVSFLLALVVAISGLYICDTDSVKADTETAATWKTTAIVSPAEGDLIGAGYIDIKWNNTLSDVSSYKVYVDGELKKTVSPSSDIMSCEFYTTSVSSHKAYIVATLKDGSTVLTSTRTFYVTKKGICVNTNDMGVALDPDDLNIGWYYNWGYTSFKDSNFSNTAFNDTEYVPMIYGDPKESFSTIFDTLNEKGYKYVLSYNEPDLSSEANTTAGVMKNRWTNEFVAKKGNLRLGSPAISTASPLMESDWWSEFWGSLSSTDKSSMSFIAVHKYYENYNASTAYEFLTLIDETYYTYGKPIWVTEFALWNADKSDAQAVANAQEFLKIVCKGLNERSYVERYSWFCPDLSGTSASASSLWDYGTGEITTIGKMYAQIGNPSGYNAKTYGVSSDTSADTSIKGCVSKQKTTLYSVQGKKKKIKYSLKNIKRTTGYQIQYSTKKNMKSAKTKKVTKTSGTIKVKFTKKQKKKIKKKKLKKIKYYVRARAIKKINGQTMYYGWSSKLKVKVKTK